MKTTYLRSLAPLTAALALAGCATVPGEPNPQDPLESMNRAVYTFNSKVDEHVFVHVVTAYRDIVPPPVRSCVSNFFGNLRDIWSAANSFMQLRVPDGINTVGRVLMNTTVGGLGCFDPATQVGVPRIPNDFGVTLGVWGVGAGPYLVLPFLGPSTARDGVGMVADFYGNVLTYSDNVRLKNTLRGISLVDQRARLVRAVELVNEVALDPYSFVRDAYLQRRQQMILGPQLEYDLPDYSLPDYDDPDAPGSLPVYEDPEAPAGHGTEASSVPARNNSARSAAEPAAAAIGLTP